MVGPLRGKGKGWTTMKNIFFKLEKKSEKNVTTKLEGGGVVVGPLGFPYKVKNLYLRNFAASDHS